MVTSLKKILLLYWLLLLCVWPCSSSMAYTTTAESSETVEMSRQTLNRLKLLVAEQQTDLTMLQTRLTRLETNSGMQSEELQKLAERVKTLQSQLRTADERLESASASLTDAKAEIENLQKSLTDLKKDLRDLEHKLKVARRQRDTWAGAFGLAIGGWIYEVVK